MHDLKYAVRALLKTRGFTTVAILTMAIAIGACTSLFSVLQTVVLKPLPYPEPDSLVSIWGVNRERNFEAPVISWSKYEAFRERRDVFSAMSMSAGVGFTLVEGTGEPEQVFGLHVSENFLPVLGISPIRGRSFTADEDREGGPLVAMISEKLWRSRFASDPAMIGRVITIDGVSREVVGLLPSPLPVPFNQAEIMVPRPLELPYLTPQNRNNAITHQAFARLAPGMTLEQANRRIQEMQQQFAAANPGHLDSNNQSEVRTLAAQVLGNLNRTFWTLAGAVAAVLLIACANIANLFLARVSARQKEIAVRMSLGARRGEIIRQFMVESLVFTLVASVGGVLFAAWSLQGIQLLAGPRLPRADEIAIDPIVLAFSLGAALLAAVLIGVYPALQASRTNVQLVLKDSGRGAGGGSAAKAFRHLLVVTQVALSLTLLICAGLLVLSFSKLQRTDLGFEPEGRAFGLINLPTARYGQPELSREFFRQLQERLNQAPELAAGGAIFGLPLNGSDAISPYLVQGRPAQPIHERPLANIRQVTSGYFAAMGIRLREGRFFTDQDRFGGENVAIINDTLARKLFPNESPLDQHFLIGPNSDIPVRIVGVIRDVKSAGLASPPPDEIYYARDQRGGAFMQVVGQARAGLSASAVIPVLRRIVSEIDPAVALAAPRTMRSQVDQSIGVQRVTMALLIAFAAIAALLAAVGIYSVMAYAVTQRTSEIGVRLALGASSRAILRLIVGAGLRQVGWGLLVGLAGALAASRLLRHVLFEVEPLDLRVFTTVAIAFAAVSALACLLPARRATRIDPLAALRAD